MRYPRDDGDTDGASLSGVADYPHPSSEGRSANMRANRRTDTKPELALRHALHRLGYRYRKDYRLDLDGGRRVRPDIAFTARKVAVFVDGCFWHACPEHGSKPRANEWYWGPKLIKNVERDRINDAALILAGWTVVRLWEHVPLDEAVSAVVTALGATVAPGPAGPTVAPGPADAAGPANPAGPANAADHADTAEPPKRNPPATDDPLG
jgi:DNA mismatch endonuclease, patch repair protein